MNKNILTIREFAPLKMDKDFNGSETFSQYLLKKVLKIKNKKEYSEDVFNINYYIRSSESKFSRFNRNMVEKFTFGNDLHILIEGHYKTNEKRWVYGVSILSKDKDHYNNYNSVSELLKSIQNVCNNLKG